MGTLPRHSSPLAPGDRVAAWGWNFGVGVSQELFQQEPEDGCHQVLLWLAVGRGAAKGWA